MSRSVTRSRILASLAVFALLLQFMTPVSEVSAQANGTFNLVSVDENGVALEGACYTYGVSVSTDTQQLLNYLLGSLADVPLIDQITGDLLSGAVNPVLNTILVDPAVLALTSAILDSCSPFQATELINAILGPTVNLVDTLLNTCLLPDLIFGGCALSLQGALTAVGLGGLQAAVLNSVVLTPVNVVTQVPPTGYEGTSFLYYSSAPFSLNAYAGGAVTRAVVWPAQDPEAGEVEAGEVEAGEVEAGEVEAGEVEAGEVEAGEVEAGEVEADEVEAGEVEAGEVEAGEVEAGEVEAGEVEAGEVEAGEVEAGEVEAGEVEAGEVEAGEVEAGEVEAGEVEAGDDGTDVPTGSITTGVYDCAEIGSIMLEYKNSTDPAAGSSGCEPGSASLTFTSVETGVTHTFVVGAGSATAQMGMPLMQFASPYTVTVNNSAAIELPAGDYTVSLDGTNVSLAITVSEGGGNPNLVVTQLAQAQTDPTPGAAPSPTPGGVSGLPSTGSGFGGSHIVWPAAAAAMVLMLLAGQFVVGTVRNRK